MKIDQFVSAENKEDKLAPFLSAQYKVYNQQTLDSLTLMKSVADARKQDADANPVYAVQQRFLDSRGTDEKAMRQQSVVDYFNDQQKYLNKSIAQEPPASEDDIAAIASIAEEDFQDASRPDRIERDYIRALAPEVAKKYEDTVALDLWLKNEMGNVLESTGYGKLAKDVAGIFLINNMSFNTKEIAEGNYFTSAGDMEEAISEIRNIPDIDERRAAMEEFIQNVVETTGNSLDQLDYLSRLEDPRDLTIEEGLDKVAAAFDVLTVVGVGSTFLPAAVAGIGGRAITGMVKAKSKLATLMDSIQDTNTVKAANQVGATDEAAILNKAALEDKVAADVMGISQDVAAANHTPYSFEGILPGAADGLSAKLSEFSMETEKIREFLQDDLVKEGLKLTDDELANFVARSQNELKAGDDVVNVRPIEQTATGWKFEVEMTQRANPNDVAPPKFKRVMGGEFQLGQMSLVRSPQGWKLYQGAWNDPNRTHVQTFNTKADAEAFTSQRGWSTPAEEVAENTTKTIVMEWDETDLSGYKVVDDGLGQAKGFLASPNIKFFMDRAQLVLPAVRTMYQQARMRAALDDMYREAYKPLGNKFTPSHKRSKAKLDEVLQLGDQWDNGPTKPTGKVFTPQELRNGVLTPDGRRVQFKDNEIESYYKTRMLMDTLHHIEDMRLVETAKLRGIQAVKFNGQDVLGKPYTTPRAALTAVGDNWVYDSRINRNTPMEFATLEEAYNAGYQLVRTEDYVDVQDAAGNLHATRWVLSNGEDLQGTPKTMLNYRTGYIPKISEDGVFFVKEGKKRSVNGRELITSRSTLGMFTTRAAAESYQAKKTEQAIQAAMANGKSREQASREVEGVYELLRDREIPEGNLTDPALFGNSPYTGGRSTREIFLDEEGNMPTRINAYESIQRALGHASSSYPMAMLRHNLQQRWLASARPHLPPEYQHDFNMAIQHITADQNGDIYRALQQTHSYIRHVIGAPSDAELKTRHSIQRFADRIETKFPKFSGVMNKYSQSRNPTQLARTVTFHSLLGGFNMSQFIVQGMGSTIAMAIDPKNYVKSQQLSMAMNALDQARSPKEFDAVMSLLTKSKFIDKAEIENVYDGWRRSGIRQDLLNTADYSQFSQHWEMANAALRAGTLPFRMGEAAHRRYTFANAYLQRAAGKKLDDVTLKEVMDRQTDLSLNMSRMNKAAWQEGAVLGVATQFRQVTAKYMEMIFGDILTTREKLTLMMGQFALFGFHGVPLGTTMQQAMQGAYSWDNEDFPADVQRFLNEGAVRSAMDAVGLEDINLITRLALGESIADLWDTTSVDSLIDFLGGPFASHVGAGTIEAVKEGTDTLRFFSGVATGEYTPMAGIQSAQEYVEKIVRGIPIVDDVTTAFMYARGLQLDKRGRMISEERDISWAEVVALAAGFSDRAPSDIYVSQSMRSESDKRINDTVDRIASRIRKKFAVGEGLSDTDKELIAFEIELTSSNEDEKTRISQLVSQALSEEPRLEKELDTLFSFMFKRGQTMDAGGTSELMLQTRERAEEIQ